VCCLLLPAVMTLLGRSAWWLPAALDRLYRRLDVPEEDDAPPASRLETKGSVSG
jgi:RND superfamily putative drug exporter